MNSKNSLFFLNKKKTGNNEKTKSTKDVSYIKQNDKFAIHIPPKQHIISQKRNSNQENSSFSKKNVFTNSGVNICKILNKKKSVPDNNFMRFDTMNKGDLVKLIIEQEVYINNLQVKHL